jgi:hypothetical protein
MVLLQHIESSKLVGTIARQDAVNGGWSPMGLGVAAYLASTTKDRMEGNCIQLLLAKASNELEANETSGKVSSPIIINMEDP